MRIRHAIVNSNKQEVIEIRQTDDGRYICPICGDLGASPSWDESVDTDEKSGLPFAFGTYSICPSCHTEYGFHDYPSPKYNRSVNNAWRHLRLKWLDEIGWAPDALAQVKTNLGITEEQLGRDAAEIRQGTPQGG